MYSHLWWNTKVPDFEGDQVTDVEIFALCGFEKAFLSILLLEKEKAWTFFTSRQECSPQLHRVSLFLFYCITSPSKYFQFQRPYLAKFLTHISSLLMNYWQQDTFKTSLWFKSNDFAYCDKKHLCQRVVLEGDKINLWCNDKREGGELCCYWYYGCWQDLPSSLLSMGVIHKTD